MVCEVDLVLELFDIEIEFVLLKGFVEDCLIDEFMWQLLELDVLFGEKVEVVKVEGKVFCYIGSIEDGKCRVSIQVVLVSNFFLQVKDGENVLVINSDYYSLIFYVIRGYGVGGMVIVVGVFVDILCIMLWK